MGHAVYSVASAEASPPPATPPYERIQAFADRFAPIFGEEKRVYLLKTIRELRGAIVFGKQVSARRIAQELAERLGLPDQWVALERPLTDEIEAFSAESEGHPRAVSSTVFDEDHGWIEENKE